MFNSNHPIFSGASVLETFNFITGYSEFAIPTIGEILTYAGINLFPCVVNNDVTVLDGTFSNETDKVLFMAEPSSQPPKTYWYNNEFNHDIVGPTHVFLSTIIGIYRVYYTEFPTSFVGDVIFQQIT